MGRQLVVQAAQNPFDGARMVVLNKRDRMPDHGIETLLVEAFHEEAAFVAEDFRLQDQHTIDCRTLHIHLRSFHPVVWPQQGRPRTSLMRAPARRQAASSENTTGTSPGSVIGRACQPRTESVRVAPDGRVRPQATDRRVLGCRSASSAPRSPALRYGVSIISCV